MSCNSFILPFTINARALKKKIIYNVALDGELCHKTFWNLLTVTLYHFCFGVKSSGQSYTQRFLSMGQYSAPKEVLVSPTDAPPEVTSGPTDASPCPYWDVHVSTLPRAVFLRMPRSVSEWWTRDIFPELLESKEVRDNPFCKNWN